MYVVKDYDERKTEFLDTAMQLFMTNGYEQTSVNAIIGAVGVSKGAFYHYFSTKEDLLDELSLRASAQSEAVVDQVLAEPGLGAIERLNKVLSSTNAFKAQNRELMAALAEVFYSDSNILLRERMSQRSVEAMTPRIAQIIEQGNAEGVMNVRRPAETARFVLRVGTDMVAEFSRDLPASSSSDPAVREPAVTRILQTLEVYTESVERILGLSTGQMRLVDESLITLIKGDSND